MNDAAPESMHLTTLMGRIRRHLLPSCLVGALIAVLVVMVSYLLTPLYRAEAMLVVEHRGANLEFLAPDDNEKGAEYSLLNTQAELLLSHQVLSQVLEKQKALFDESPAYARSNDRIELLHDRLRVETNQYNWIIHISLEDPDPRLAETALASLIQSYLEDEHLRLEGSSHSALIFLTSSAAKAREDLANDRSQEEKYRHDNGIIQEDPDHNLYTTEIETLDASRTSQITTRNASQGTIDELDAIAQKPDPDLRLASLMRIPQIHGDPLVAQLEQNLLALQERQAAFAQKFKPAHPQMLDISKQVEATKGELVAAVDAAREAIVDQYRGVISAQQALDERIQKEQDELAAYRKRLIVLQALTLKTASTEQLFQSVDHNLQEEEIFSHRQQLSVSLADPPHVTSWPVNVRRSLFALAGVFLGLIAMAANALIADALDHRIRHADAPCAC